MQSRYADLLQADDAIKSFQCNVPLETCDAGDGFTMFIGCTVLTKDVIVDNQALINYIQSLPEGALAEKYSNPYGEGRITFVNADE